MDLVVVDIFNPENIQGIKAVVNRFEYNVNEAFLRAEDVAVYEDYGNGSLLKIPSEEIAVAVVKDQRPLPGTSPNPDGSFPSFDTGNYLWQTAGRKEMVLSSKNWSVRYTVLVWNPFGYSDGGNDPGSPGAGEGSGGGNIITVWGP